MYNGVMLNLYPDSMGGTLRDVAGFLALPQMKDAFRSVYLLPSVFDSDLDRGFSVISYGLNKTLADEESLARIKALPLDLKFDFVLNHLSILSPQFQDILEKGPSSPYVDFFIRWNRFWEGKGKMTAAGYIQPQPELIEHMFFRKPGLPILFARMPDGTEEPYWNTFYQEVIYPEPDVQDWMRGLKIQYAQAKRIADAFRASAEKGETPDQVDLGDNEAYRKAALDMLNARRRYLGQMDLNLRSPLVWDFYRDTLRRLKDYGASIIRLDAFAYAPKTPGKNNFMNEPDTWDTLDRVRGLAEPMGLTLLPEIHASYAEGVYEKIARKGYMTYDFFLPGLIIDALENHEGRLLLMWAEELRAKNIHTVNMLGCHDGIPLLDLKGLLPDDRIQGLIDLIVARGGMVKNLHGQKNVYYQVNATYYSALGENDAKLLLARALQLFMPGKPQVWYLDLFAGKNDHAAVERGGGAGHKEINRTNLTTDQMLSLLQTRVVSDQLWLLRLRNTCPAFAEDAAFSTAQARPDTLRLAWKKDGCYAALDADLSSYAFTVSVLENGKKETRVFA